MNWLAYFIIALIIMIIVLIYYVIKDMEYLNLIVFIQDIAEAAIISVSWALSIPILGIANIIIAFILMIFGEDNEE